MGSSDSVSSNESEIGISEGEYNCRMYCVNQEYEQKLQKLLAAEDFSDDTELSMRQLTMRVMRNQMMQTNPTDQHDKRVDWPDTGLNWL